MSRVASSPSRSSPSTMGSPGPSRSVFSSETTPTTEMDVDPLAGMDIVAGASGSFKAHAQLKVPDPRRRERHTEAAVASVPDHDGQSSGEEGSQPSLSQRLDRLIHLSADLLAVSRFATGLETSTSVPASVGKDPPYVHRRLNSQTSASAKGSPTTASAPSEQPVPERATPSKKAKDVGQLLKAAMEDNVLDDEGSFFDVRARGGKGFEGSDILQTPPDPKDPRMSARSQHTRPSISPIKMRSSAQAVGVGHDGDKPAERGQRWSLPFGIRPARTVSRSHLSLQPDTKALQDADPPNDLARPAPRSPVSPRSSFNSASSAKAPSTPSGRGEATQAASPTLVTRTSYTMMQDGRTRSTASQDEEDDSQTGVDRAEDSPARSSIVDLLRSFSTKIGT